MLNPIKAFNCVNSIIQSNTGYSFSFSHIPQNVNKIALPAIALAAGYIVAVNAEDLPRRCLEEDYDDCIDFCSERALQYPELTRKFYYELGKCARICMRYCP